MICIVTQLGLYIIWQGDMAGEKSEKATPKKRRDSRKEGEVVKSTELINNMTLAAAVLAIKLLWDNMMSRTKLMMVDFIGSGTEKYMHFDYGSLNVLFVECIKTFAYIVFPVMAAVLVVGVLGNYLQVGFLFTPKSIGFKGNRISPLEGFKKVFSKKALMEMVKVVAKMGFIALIAYSGISDVLPDMITLLEKSVDESLQIAVDLIVDISFRIIIGLTVVAIADYIFKYFDHEKRLKMSKQEVKDEMKNSDGDPQIKSQIRNKQLEMASKRMMNDVKDADVVITNPTHFAVALKYDTKEGKAPIVVAKGQDYVAQKIKEIAKENEVSIVENIEIARSLYKSTKIGEEIPYDMFQAVAEILAYVYGMKKDMKGR